MSWSITITDTNSTDYTPPLLSPPGEEFPQRRPQANGRPLLEIAVPPERDSSGDPQWFGSEFEEADVSVSFDGTTQPFDTLIGVEDRAGTAQDYVILTIEGGDVTQKPVDREFGIIETHLAAKEVIEQDAGVTADVPTPSTTTDEDVLVQDRLEGIATSDLFRPIPDDKPVQITSDNTLTQQQTLFLDEISPSLSAPGDSESKDITLGYDVPADRVSMGIVIPAVTDVVGIECKINGTVIGEIQPGEDFGSTQWVRFEGGDERIPAGNYTMSIECTQDTDDARRDLTGVAVEGYAFYDNKFSYTFDAALNDGPELYPQSQQVRFNPAIVTRAVPALRIRSYWANQETGANQLDNGTELYAAPGGEADSSFSFDQRGPLARGGVYLGRYGDRGQFTQKCTGYRLFADLETMPLVVDETLTGTVGDVLDDLAQVARGDFVWAYDTDSGGSPTIRFVRTGSRTSTQNDLEDYSVRKSVGDRLDQVTVRGGRVDVTGEGLTLQHGTAVVLNRDAIVGDSETVYEIGRGTVYERGASNDYTIDYQNGTITANANGAIADGERVRVSYRFQPSATDTDDSVSTVVRSATVDIPQLSSDQACRLAAGEILDAAQSPDYTASATIRGNTTYSVVAALASSVLPATDLDTVDIQADAAGTQVRLEGQQSLGGAVADIRDRIESVARYTR
jgi:hypothetical protein